MESLVDAVEIAFMFFQFGLNIFNYKVFFFFFFFNLASAFFFYLVITFFKLKLQMNQITRKLTWFNNKTLPKLNENDVLFIWNGNQVSE